MSNITLSNIAFITLSNNYWYNFYAKFPLPKVSSPANVLVNFLQIKALEIQTDQNVASS